MPYVSVVSSVLASHNDGRLVSRGAYTFVVIFLLARCDEVMKVWPSVLCETRSMVASVCPLTRVHWLAIRESLGSGVLV